MSGWRWSPSPSTAFRWIDLNFSVPNSLFRWPRHFASYFTHNWTVQSPNWSSIGISDFTARWWPDFNLSFSIVDDVLWSVVTAFESVALVSMLCFFFVFCGCTL